MWFTLELLNGALESQGGNWTPVSWYFQWELHHNDYFPEPIGEVEVKTELLFQPPREPWIQGCPFNPSSKQLSQPVLWL
jgi:hypothetical protein